MSLAPYGRLLRRPAVLRLVLVSLVARIPHAAVGVVLTLHVVGTLDLGYGHAGVVAAAMTVGMAVGAPWRGRRVDALGLRRALLPSVVVEAAVWACAPLLGYRSLLVAAVVAGLFMVPVFSVIRQSLSVLVPEEEQRTAFALDSVCTELTFMLAPVLGVLVATTWSTTAALVVLGVATVGAGALLLWFDPPTRTASPGSDVAGTTGEIASPGAHVGSPGRVVTPALLVTLLAASASSLVVTGTDVSIVAVLDEWDRVPDTGWMIALWAGGSVVGGLAYGAGSRAVRPLTLVLVLALLTVPAALAGSPLWLAAAVVLAGVPCAPALSSITAAIVRLVPESRRGEAMGWSGSAMTVGAALGAPLCGLAIDGAGASAGFLVAGGVGVLIAGGGLVALAVARGRGPRGSVDVMDHAVDPGPTDAGRRRTGARSVGTGTGTDAEPVGTGTGPAGTKAGPLPEMALPVPTPVGAPGQLT